MDWLTIARPDDKNIPSVYFKFFLYLFGSEDPIFFISCYLFLLLVTIIYFSAKGIELFQQAIKISPQNASANYGLGSALLGLAKECVNSGAFRWGASLLEVSVSK